MDEDTKLNISVAAIAEAEASSKRLKVLDNRLAQAQAAERKASDAIGTAKAAQDWAARLLLDAEKQAAETRASARALAQEVLTEMEGAENLLRATSSISADVVAS